MRDYYDLIVVGTGVAGLFHALQLPQDKKILLLTKESVEDSNSYLAQGGVCVQRDDEDFNIFVQDTQKAGHYKNNPESVETMVRESRNVISKLIEYGVPFEREKGELKYTREGGHRNARILYCADQTGKAIMDVLISKVNEKDNITLLEHTKVVDLIVKDNNCNGVWIEKNGELTPIFSNFTVLATGGIGGLYSETTNFSHITGDGLALALEYGVPLKDMEYIQIHPTSLYDEKPGRNFLISEAVRGEGAHLLNKKGERFVDELKPRDIVANRIKEEMKADGRPFVSLDMKPIGDEKMLQRFPNIISKCREIGVDPLKDYVPVVPAQHYCMGGIATNLNSSTSLNGLFAIGEVSCNGVHGANRLASNSLLESLVFAAKAAEEIKNQGWSRSIDKENISTGEDKVSSGTEKLKVYIDEVKNWQSL